MRNIDLVILYEMAVRELDVACALKCILQNRYGYQVEVVQTTYGDYEAIRDVNPRLLAMPYFYHEHNHNAYLLAWPDAILLNLTWEQFFYPGNVKVKTPSGLFAENHVLHHSWGQFYTDFLLRQGIVENLIFTNGNPALALYDEKYRDYFQSRESLALRHNLADNKKWVFFPENFNWAFYADKMLNNFIRRGLDPEEARKMQKFTWEYYAEAMKWCASLAAGSEIEVILRPRPATLLKTFKRALSCVVHEPPDNMHVIQDQSVRDWILASDVTVSNYSTSLIEAAVAERPVCLLECMPFPESLSQDWYQLLPHITSEAEFREFVMNMPNSTSGKSLGNWARSTMLSNGNPIENLAAYINRLLRGDEPPPPKPDWSNITLKKRLPGVPRKVVHWLRMFRFNELHRINVAAQKEVPERVSRWAGIIKK